MNHRISSLIEGIRTAACCCNPVKKPYKVKYFKKVPDERQPGMVKGVWATEVVDAYNKEGAARAVNLKLRPGYNCFVTRIMPVEEEDDAV